MVTLTTHDVAGLGRALLTFIYPPHCVLCDQLIDATALVCESAIPQCEGMCQACVTTILAQPPDRCPRCSAPTSIEGNGRLGGRISGEPGIDSSGVIGCPTCASWPSDCSFRRAVALGAFDGPLRAAVHALKFNGNKRIGRQVGRWIGSDSMMPRLDAIAPVPLHPARQRERGYNQAEYIARGVADTTEASLIPSTLVRTRATAPQALADSAEDRMANLRDAFDTPSGELEAIRPGGILGLVDDVLTTGATLDACGRAILRLRPDLELVAVVAAIALRDVDPGGPDPDVA